MSGSGISCTVCKSVPRSRQITTLASHHSGSPGKRAVKWVCVCVCVCACYLVERLCLHETVSCRLQAVLWSRQDSDVCRQSSSSQTRRRLACRSCLPSADDTQMSPGCAWQNTHTRTRAFNGPFSGTMAWHSGRTSVSGRRTFPVLRSTCS